MTLLVILTSLLQLADADSVHDACGENAQAQTLALLIMAHESQQRPVLECNELLASIAAQRAVDLLSDSKSDGLTPNQILTMNGFKFASFYPPSGNQVEASATEVETPESALDYLARSYQHRDLILGDGEFFSRQSQIGVGYYKNANNETQYVVLIAEPHSSPKMVINLEFKAPKTTTADDCPKTWRHSKNDELKKTCREAWLRRKEGNE